MIAAAAGCKVVIHLPPDSESKGYNPITRSLFSTRKLESLGWSISGEMREKIFKMVEMSKL